MKILKFSKYTIKSLTILFFMAGLVFGLSNQAFAQKKYVVVLDAGHGGKDPGNLGNGYKEKKIALRVALDVGKELLTAKDVEVVYTRKRDVFVELHNRAKIANDKKADLFVSIHCDSYSKERAHGAGTFVLGLRGNSKNLEIAKRENAVILLEDNYKQNYDYDPNSPESLIGLSLMQETNLDNSLLIAGLIQTNFSNLRRFDRKVKQDNFLVLRETIMPSVLVELGFLTNRPEGRFLNSRRGQIKMAKAIAEAIKKYIRQLKLNSVNSGFTVVKTKKKTEVIKKKTPIKKKTIPAKTNVAETKIKKNPTKVSPPVKKKVVAATTKKTSSTEKAPVAKVKTSVEKKKDNKVVFRVQIAASKAKLSTSNFNFKGLRGVDSKYIEGYYKYFYGKTSDFQEVKQLQAKAREAGHTGAFVVAFKGNVKISVKEALKTL